MKQQIEKIQSSGFRAVILVAGGSSGAVHQLLSHPGASRFVLDVQIPYSREAMADLLSNKPVSYCSEKTAQHMCEVAYKRAIQWTAEQKAVGIACTAALSTIGSDLEHGRAYIAFQTADRQIIYPVLLSVASRILQEEELSRILLEKLTDFLVE